ncbi:MAG TPA: HAMP domain-containing sensor histidine kinase [Pilimelia sp.]|nr:HAMP domain-containing sensor histidine kinase [Pilimelia sp.]
MTGERRYLASPLGRRLLAAFALVALSSVAVLTVAALVGTDRGLASAHRSEREQVAGRVAAAVGTAYADARGWPGADLSTASAIADAAGARLVVRDTGGTTMWPGRGMGPGMGGMHPDAAGGGVIEAPVVVAGQRVGTVRLAFATAAAGGRTVAWSWVIGAALVALAAALAVSGYVSRRLTRPLVALAGAARRFAAGDRGVRTGIDAPGELGEVAHAFDTMADEVVRAETVRRRLAADVAHELRTPLAALQAGLEELRDGLREPDTQRLAALHDQTLRLGRVVADLADLSAAESAALSLRPVDTDLAEVARAALAARRPQLDATGLRVDADLTGPVPVRADPDRIHQAIANLLANAVRYCRPGDRVTVRAHTEHGSAVLTVADTGPGIPANELPHIFDRLWRGQHARTVAGSGIGLAVVRELVAAHGGTVTAESPPGGGTTVTIRLPQAVPDPPGPRRR